MDKEKLKKLVAIIGDLLKVEGNEWLTDEILSVIGRIYPINEIAKHSIIQHIHEYCVEQKIDKQATGFYSSFPINELREQLILDYKKMEHERRRDDFENFCLCLYQQIENITIFLFESQIIGMWYQDRNNLAFTYPNGSSLSRTDLIFYNAKDWGAKEKFKATLFYFYFSEKIKYLGRFHELFKVFEEIYQMRNQNHRGSKPSDSQQNILNKIKGNESKYYFKFYGFLEDFVTKIEHNISNPTVSTEKLIEQNNTSGHTSKNTLGEDPKNNRIFEQLRQKI